MAIWEIHTKAAFGMPDATPSQVDNVLAAICGEESMDLLIIQGPPKKCIHTLTDGICVLFLKVN